MLRISALLSLLLLSGCCGSDESPSQEVDVNGVVTVSGKIPPGATLSFQPTAGKGLPAVLSVKPDGSFSGKMKAGTYTYFISAPEGNVKVTVQLGGLPEVAKKGSLDRQVEIRGGTVQLSF